MELIIPKDYDPRLSIRETQDAIKYIRDTFQKEMGREMHLERISAPLFVEKSSGLNDNLNGTERPVSFDMLGLPGETLEVVHSLAKWKRMALKKYGFKPGEGLYTNMNAIRRDSRLWGISFPFHLSGRPHRRGRRYPERYTGRPVPVYPAQACVCLRLHCRGRVLCMP